MLSLSCRSGASLAKMATRQIFTSRAAIRAPQSALQKQAQQLGKQELREHFERIAATTRPISPHLMIYKMESHMFMSLMHRATGGYMAVLVAGIGGISLVWPDWFNQASLLLSSVHPIFTTGVKFCIVMPFTLHVANAIRHAAQDYGYLMQRATLTSTYVGFFVLAVGMAGGLALWTIK